MVSTLSFVAALLLVHIVSANMNPNLVKAANFAITEHNRRTNSACAFKIVEILSHLTQMYPPTRVKYTITARVAETNCANDGSVNLEDCNLMTNAQMLICRFVVLTVPGTDRVPSTLLSDNCA